MILKGAKVRKLNESILGTDEDRFQGKGLIIIDNF